ncbi:MAG: DUF2461 domain-containing protein [Gemmatimonadota bacterium]
MIEFDGFGPAAQRFFRSLARNNNKAWFEANRAVYEGAIREPMKALVEALDVRLASFAPELTGDPKRSLFRINRDIRFSKDKSPYKTNAGCWFYHRDAGRGVGQEADGGGAGYYFHLDGSKAFVAGGIWGPARPALNKIREVIADDPKALSKILDQPAFKRRFGTLDSEMKLTRVPRGFAPDHPAGELLKYQSFTVGRTLAPGETGSRKLIDALAKDFAAMLPLVRWLNRALDYKPAMSRL